MNNFPITITSKACNAFLENLKTDGSENKYVRIFIRGGGCSGFQYCLDIADKPDDEDLIHEQDTVKFLVDQYSLPYLEGMTIDYNTNLLESGFKFLNPKATKTCGCGSSFSI